VARLEAQQRREAPYISEIERLSKELFSIIDAQDFSAIERERIEHAYHLAMRLHAQQDPRSDGPYTHHILRVALRVARTQGANADSIAAALLHDAVEDQPEALSLLMRRKNGERVDRVSRFTELFGEDVFDIVTLLTKKPPRLGHKKPEYREFILGLVTDERALLVKISDFLDNALGILEKPDELRIRLARKWKPVVPLLIMALMHLKHEHGLLNTQTRQLFISELQEAGRRLTIATQKPRRSPVLQPR
jgi:(p)ppGpp synthase/HD superfamily hydrolase